MCSLSLCQTLEQVSSQRKASYLESMAEYNAGKNRYPDKLPSECLVMCDW